MNNINRIKNDYKQVNNVFYLNKPDGKFEDIYIRLRSAEGRIYNDSEVNLLPDIPPMHRHYEEWKIRKKSSGMLTDYIGLNKIEKSILDIGSGNGWLSNKLADLDKSEVIGADINIAELEQSARVFGNRENILFLYGDIFNLKLKFDYIILAAAAAYFKDLDELISSLLTGLKPGGEIHIMDSPFYKNTLKAKQNSAKYFIDLGFDEMINYYHHHSMNEIKKFKYEILYNPGTFANKLKRKIRLAVPPFYWIKITE